MGSADDDTLKNIQKKLEPYIRPRDEVGRIRQILAVHLDSCLNDGAAVAPLALVDTSSVKTSSSARGLQQEYLEALNANLQARREFAACCEQRRPDTKETAGGGSPGTDRLQEHLATIRLRQRREKLLVIEGCLSSLAQKPAASPGFLDADEIFRDSRPLPDVPKELVTALTVDKTAVRPQLKALIDQLERHVLETKMILKREEQLLEKVKSRSTARPESITESAKLEALNKTRVELINWMEAELSKAAGDDGEAEGQDSQKQQRAHAESINMEEQLSSIKEKYAQYLEARKTLLRLVNEQPRTVIKPPPTEMRPSAPAELKAPPTAHLLAPYLEQLLAISREQKGLIAHKSHLNAAISKQLKDNRHVLDHLAEESQLVPAHPMPGGARSNAALGDATSGIDGFGPSGRVKPWVFAADSAKISTLEAVAEKIEEGQVALEASMRTLGELGQLLGQPAVKQKDERVSAREEDLWLSEGQPVDRVTGARKHTVSKADKPAQPRTVWDMLDGNLGLLRSEKDTP